MFARWRIDAITTSAYTSRWGYGGDVEIDPRPGGVYRNLTTDEMKQMGMGEVAVNGAVVLSLRGGDFELTIGSDLSIGYQSHTDKVVRLYLIETMAFRVLTPEAAVALVHKDGKGARKG